MRIIAIVGCSNPAEFSVNLAHRIHLFLKNFNPNDTLVISGGARGTDTITINTAKQMGFMTKVYPPEFDGWEAYKKRNLIIANECDEIACFTTLTRTTRCYHCNADHEKTAGCWTVKQVAENKPRHTIICTVKNVGR